MLEKLLCVISVGYVFCPWGVRGCPEPCVCQDKYFNQFADCAYKNFQAVPVGLPSNVTTLSLSANKIKSLLRADFAEVTQVTSLWLAHNEIRKIEKGSLTVLLQLKNLDISHNQIVDFPWEDLYNLTALQLLKMNNNYMVHLSRDAFSNLKELRSLRINSNKFHTIWEGTFDSLSSLSHLQIYSNPFSCTCNLQWLKGWIDQALISIPEQKDIVCSAPEEFKGTPVVELPDMQCIAPLVHLTYQASNEKGELYEGYALTMHCNATGSPVPVIRWKIQTANKEIELNDANVEPERNELLLENRKEVRDRFVVLKNGTLVIPHLTKYEEGAYTCLATNEIGSNRSTLNVAVTASPKREPTYIQERIPSQPGERKPGLKLPKNNAISWAKPGQKGQRISPATARSFPGQGTERNAVFLPPVAKNCSKSQGSHYITNHAFNRSSEMKQHTFDYGIIALEVTETDAKVQLTPFQTAPDKISLEMLYLCAEQGGKAATVVQWSMIESGVNSYRFQGLNPGSNYTLCLTYTGQDCQVQVVFSTRRKIPSLLIMIIVSSFLLGLATIPLVAATCCHLMYKYRGKTYKLIMKTQPPESLHQNAPCTFDPSASFQGSEKIYNPSEVGEESVVAESVPVSQTKANPEEFEACSEYSDRLPLGAEAVNISPEINGNYRQPVR